MTKREREMLIKSVSWTDKSLTVNEEKAFQAGAKWADKTMIEKACNVFCHTGCPHKTDSYNCLNNKCDTWKIFRRMLEE